MATSSAVEASVGTKVPLVSCLEFTRTATQPPRYVDFHVAPSMCTDKLLDLVFKHYPRHLTGRVSVRALLDETPPPRDWDGLQALSARLLDARLYGLLEKASLEPRKKRRRRRKKKKDGEGEDGGASDSSGDVSGGNGDAPKRDTASPLAADDEE